MNTENGTEIWTRRKLRSWHKYLGRKSSPESCTFNPCFRLEFDSIKFPLRELEFSHHSCHVTALKTVALKSRIPLNGPICEPAKNPEKRLAKMPFLACTILLISRLPADVQNLILLRIIDYSNILFLFQDIPIVIVANKIDLVREVDSADVISWIESDLPRLR